MLSVYALKATRILLKADEALILLVRTSTNDAVIFGRLYTPVMTLVRSTSALVDETLQVVRREHLDTSGSATAGIVNSAGTWATRLTAVHAELDDPTRESLIWAADVCHAVLVELAQELSPEGRTLPPSAATAAPSG